MLGYINSLKITVVQLLNWKELSIVIYRVQFIFISYQTHAFSMSFNIDANYSVYTLKGNLQRMLIYNFLRQCIRISLCILAESIVAFGTLSKNIVLILKCK